MLGFGAPMSRIGQPDQEVEKLQHDNITAQLFSLEVGKTVAKLGQTL